MPFKEIDYRGKKPEIRAILRQIQDVKKRVRYHKVKIDHHDDKIKLLEGKILVDLEAKLNNYLGKTE